MIISIVIIVIFGGATLLLHDETFIKWIAHYFYAVFSAALILSRWIFGIKHHQGDACRDDDCP
jgi:intracellular septation protein